MAPGDAGSMVFCNHHSSQQLSLYKGEPSSCSQAAPHHPANAPFHKVKGFMQYWRSFPAGASEFSSTLDQRKQKVSIHNSLNCCFPAVSRLSIQQVPGGSKHCTCRAATAPPMGTVGAEDGVRSPCADQQSCICVKEGIPL